MYPCFTITGKETVLSAVKGVMTAVVFCLKLFIK